MEKIMELLNNRLFSSAVIFLLTFLLIKIIGKIFKKADKNQIHLKFAKNLTQGFIIVIAIFLIGNKFPVFEKFSTTILASSSLLVVVIGFALQEGLSTIIHGFMISIFKPFNIGDRIRIEEKNITGIVENITLRHTTIKNVMTSALIKIPNDLVDKAIIENFAEDDEITHSNFLDITIRYDDDIDKAMEIIKNTIINHPLTIDVRTDKQEEDSIPQVSILVRDLSARGIELRATSVVTKTISDNFKACSDIRYTILKEFKKNNIHIPYTTNELLGEINIRN